MNQYVYVEGAEIGFGGATLYKHSTIINTFQEQGLLSLDTMIFKGHKYVTVYF